MGTYSGEKRGYVRFSREPLLPGDIGLGRMAAARAVGVPTSRLAVVTGVPAFQGRGRGSLGDISVSLVLVDILQSKLTNLHP